MRRRLPPGTKDRALALIKAGENQTKIAAEVGVSVSTINKWALALEAGAAGNTSVPSGGEGPGMGAEAGALTPTTEGPGPDLSTLIAQHPTKTIPTDTGIPSAIQAPTEPPKEPPKPIAPDALIAVAGVAKAMVVTTVAGLYKVQLTEKESAILCGFSEPERKSLELLAPYAAEYTGEMGNYAKPLMAALFCGAVGFSTVNSIKAVKSKVPPKPVNVMKRKKYERARA